MTNIVERLRAGEEVWRVADPKTGAYCMEYSWANSSHPELDAGEWLAKHVHDYPQSHHANKVVVKHVVVDPLHADAADELDRLRAALMGLLDLFHEGQVTARDEASGYVQAAVSNGEAALEATK